LKLSKATFIILAIGVFAIIAAGLGMTYSQQDREQTRLNEELALAQLRLKKYPAQQLSSEKQKLESQMAKTESEIKTAEDSLDKSIESIEASAALYQLALDCHVEVTEINSTGVTTEAVEGVALSVLPLTVRVEGDVPNLIDFIHKWTKAYPTGMVKSLEMDVPKKVEEELIVTQKGEVIQVKEEEEKTKEEKPSVVINLIIYTLRVT
jgi:hypothetical protein